MRAVIDVDTLRLGNIVVVALVEKTVVDETLLVPSAPDAVGIGVLLESRIDGDDAAEKLLPLLSDDILLGDPKSVELDDESTEGD